MFNVNSVTRVSEYVMCCGTPHLVSERVFSLTGCSSKKDNECPMRVKYAMLADYAMLSRDNKISVIGIFDEINAPVLPFTMPQMYVVVALEGEVSEIDQEFTLELLLWDPDGNSLFSLERHFTFAAKEPGQRPAHNEIGAIGGLPFATAGPYSFIIRVNNEERERLVLQVNDASGGTGS